MHRIGNNQKISSIRNYEHTHTIKYDTDIQKDEFKSFYKLMGVYGCFRKVAISLLNYPKEKSL